MSVMRLSVFEKLHRGSLGPRNLSSHKKNCLFNFRALVVFDFLIVGHVRISKYFSTTYISKHRKRRAPSLKELVQETY